MIHESTLERSYPGSTSLARIDRESRSDLTYGGIKYNANNDIHSTVFVVYDVASASRIVSLDVRQSLHILTLSNVSMSQGALTEEQSRRLGPGSWDDGSVGQLCNRNTFLARFINGNFLHWLF